MFDRAPEHDDPDGSAETYSFVCPACEQEIAVNEEMKRAIISNGCPVCAIDIQESSFRG